MCFLHKRFTPATMNRVSLIINFAALHNYFTRIKSFNSGVFLLYLNATRQQRNCRCACAERRGASRIPNRPCASSAVLPFSQTGVSPARTSETLREPSAVQQSPRDAEPRRGARTRTMSANKTKKVKMATKSCPECDQQVRKSVCAIQTPSVATRAPVVI